MSAASKAHASDVSGRASARFAVQQRLFEAQMEIIDVGLRASEASRAVHRREQARRLPVRLMHQGPAQRLARALEASFAPRWLLLAPVLLL